MLQILSINVVKQVDPESDDAKLTGTQLDIGFSTTATINKQTNEVYNIIFMHIINQLYVGV